MSSFDCSPTVGSACGRQANPGQQMMLEVCSSRSWKEKLIVVADASPHRKNGNNSAIGGHCRNLIGKQQLPEGDRAICFCRVDNTGCQCRCTSVGVQVMGCLCRHDRKTASCPQRCWLDTNAAARSRAGSDCMCVRQVAASLQQLTHHRMLRGQGQALSC